jgi:hypothetical protein
VQHESKCQYFRDNSFRADSFQNPAQHVSCGFARVFVGQLGHWFDARVSRIDKGRLAIFAEADRMQMAQVTQH